VSPLIYVAIALVVIVGAVFLVVSGMRKRQTDDDPLATRLAEISQTGEVVSLEDVELSQPFMERVVYPMVKKIGDLSSRFTPQHQLATIAKKLEQAGNPGRLEPATFLALRFVVAGAFGGILGVVFFFSNNWPTSREVLVALGATGLGFVFPQLWLTSTIQKRQKNIRRAMPDALDLLTICVEAGLGFDAALSKVSEKWENDLSIAFSRAIREIQLGKLRREALKDMSERVGIPEMTSFVAAIIQSETLGVSMSKVLRIQADQMRVKRRQRAEEEAHKAPIKMIIPLGIFIFPSLLIILLTPAAFRFMDAFGNKSF
jgi:tight adherence protein C